jgi:hypothetical protein
MARSHGLDLVLLDDSDCRSRRFDRPRFDRSSGIEGRGRSSFVLWALRGITGSTFSTQLWIPIPIFGYCIPG